MSGSHPGRTVADISRPGANQLAGRVLLDRVADPADRPSDREDHERSAWRQAQYAPDAREGKVEIWMPTSRVRGRPRHGKPERQFGRFRVKSAEQIEQRLRPRVAVRVERMAEAIERLAPREPGRDRGGKVARPPERFEHRFDARARTAMLRTLERG